MKGYNSDTEHRSDDNHKETRMKLDGRIAIITGDEADPIQGAASTVDCDWTLP